MMINDEKFRKIHEESFRRELEKMIKAKEFVKMGNSTTICLLILKNGFEVIGTSQLFDYNLFNKKIGEDCAYENALLELKQIWSLIKALKENGEIE
jgi:hypothetical protein